MGCGCNKNKGMRGVGRRPVVSPRKTTSQGPTLTPRNSEQVSAQSQKSEDPGLTASRRAIEKKRRDAILKKLGRL